MRFRLRINGFENLKMEKKIYGNLYLFYDNENLNLPYSFLNVITVLCNDLFCVLLLAYFKNKIFILNEDF